MTQPDTNGAAEQSATAESAGNPALLPSQASPIRLLSQEERNDLRKRVIAGEALSLDEARQVIETTRQGRGAAALSAESKPKRKAGTKKPSMSDEDLAASLDEKLKF